MVFYTLRLISQYEERSANLFWPAGSFWTFKGLIGITMRLSVWLYVWLYSWVTVCWLGLDWADVRPVCGCLLLPQVFSLDQHLADGKARPTKLRLFSKHTVATHCQVQTHTALLQWQNEVKTLCSRTRLQIHYGIKKKCKTTVNNMDSAYI